MNDHKLEIILIAKNPSQYHRCLYHELNKTNENSEVWYLKKNPILARFGQSEDSNDIFDAMLDGHNYKFIKKSRFNMFFLIIDILKSKPKFVIFTGYDSLLFFTLPIIKIFGIKLIWRGEVYYKITGNKKLLLKPFFAFYDAVILSTARAVSVMSELVKVNKIKYVPSCVDSKYLCDYYSANLQRQCTIREKIGLEKDDIVINVTARFSYEKNIEEIINILHKVKINNLKLLIVGSGELKNKLLEKVQELGLSEKVIFTGFKTGSELYDCYIASDYSINLSHWDYSPKSMNESLHFGLIPIFTKRIGTYQEIISLDIPCIELPEINNTNINANILQDKIKIVIRDVKNNISFKSKKYSPTNFSKCVNNIIKEVK